MTKDVSESPHALVAFGANLPFQNQQPLETIKAAIEHFSFEKITVLACSAFYRTPCFPIGAGPDYINGCIKLEMKMESTAASILETLHRIEANFGRQRDQRWGGRSLDLDLLALGDQILPDLECYLCWQDLTLQQQKITAPSELILPHPRLHERSFVLVPLADIAPDWRHPVRKRSVVQMLGDLLPAEVGAVLAGKLID